MVKRIFVVNEVNVGHINGYIAKLGEKGFKGEITPLNQNDVPSIDFNEAYKTLYPIYKSVGGYFCYAEGLLSRLEKDLNITAFRADEIEKRKFKFQIELLIEEIKNFSEVLRKDNNILKGYEPNLLIDSLEAWGQNYVILGTEKGEKILKDINTLAELLNAFETTLKNLYQDTGLNRFIPELPEEDENTTISEVIEIRNTYVKINYSLKGLNENIEKRLLEIKTDREILVAVGSGKI